MVFDRAKTELPNGSTTSLAAFLSARFEEQFGHSKNERTFARYYKNLVVDHTDYAIDEITLDQLSTYIGFRNFEAFAREVKGDGSDLIRPLKVTVSDGENSVSNLSETLSNIVIHITNSPVFTIPEFISQHKNSFGVVGFLLLGSFIASQSGYFQKQTVKSLVEMPDTVQRENSLNRHVPVQKETGSNHDVISQIPVTVSGTENGPDGIKTIIPERKKECMYWKEDHYEAVFCDEKISGNAVIALDEGQYKQLKKITLPDTLTVENSLGKVWYDKSNNHLDFFTGYGIHPLNGKTLRPITRHIIQQHIE
ncbi:hypothetical protein KSK37_13735 [Kaistella sp. DKR-2]|uniref:hypothetical protein n=1 Tax=Kaistella soli TaxID=2849654 RepID=UPI001C25229F|nr:hypothetical protein [Kaistella soli]MBU8884148.1 hypothetical protein [Kaistella soli]